MAFRLKTIEYAWETNQTVVSSSNYFITSTKQIEIPETGSRTFLSVVGEFSVRDAVTTAIGGFTYFVSCSIDGNLTGKTLSGAITITGDHQHGLYRNTFTSHFNQYFTGSSHNIFSGWRSSWTQPYSLHTYKLYITYQYEDTFLQTAIKTVRLPIDTIFDTLVSTSARTFGPTLPSSYNIPALDSFLPESTKNYKNIWLEYWANDASGATTDINLFTQIDSGSESTRGRVEQALITDTSYFDIQEISGTIDTSTTHTLKARSSVDNRFSHVTPTLCVTYTYRDDQTTQVLNSLMFPFSMETYTSAPFYNGNDIGGNLSFLVPEANISNLYHSALVFTELGPTSSLERNFYVNNQLVARSTIAKRMPVHSGATKYHVRFDDLAATSSGYTLRRGFNKIPIKTTISGDGGFTPVSGYAILNYSSSKLTTPQETLIFSNEQYITNNPTVQLNLYAVTSSIYGGIHDSLTSSYYNNGCIIGVHGIGGNFATTTTTHQYLNSVIYFYTGSDGQMAMGEDVVNICNTLPESGVKMGFKKSIFSDYPNHPNNKLNIFKNNYTNKVSLSPVSVNTNFPLQGSTLDYFLTYNSLKYSVTGTLQNCLYATTDYQISVYTSGSNPYNGSVIVNTISTGSGSTKYFYFDWYDNVDKIYAVSSYPEQKMSNFVTASNGNILTIDFSNTITSGSSSEHSYIFIG
jgi:hypothetical protein